jgi:APA family basic amino acid/polyamine antiporter
MTQTGLTKKLTLFDVTNLVVGAIIGADIYVASSFGAKILGPFSIAVWVVAGVIAMVIALCFAMCAGLVPKVGGPYAYAKEAFGPFSGFIVGWSLWFAELISLAVFPLAFTQYLAFFSSALANDFALQAVVKIAFVVFLAVTNIVGVKAAGRVNDVLTIAKLAPLVFFVVAGVGWMTLNMGAVGANFAAPMMSFGFSNFGTALVLIFWAYAGFEISTIPAEEIAQPEKTIPKAIVLGIVIVIVFYLTTNVVLFGVRNWNLLATDTAPLASAGNSIFSSSAILALVGGGIVGVGALISVAGSNESGMIGTSRLGFSLAADGLFPKVFARIHPRFKTPSASIIIQSSMAVAAAVAAPLFGGLSLLIAVSVFFMAVAYLATCASVFVFRRRHLVPAFRLRGGIVLAALGIVFSAFLITQCTLLQLGLGAALLLVGVPIYVKYSPKKEIAELKAVLLSTDNVWRRIYWQERTFLAHALLHLKQWYREATRKTS